MSDKIKEFINDVCEDLDISAPKIVEATIDFPTVTTIAAYDDTTDSIYLRHADENSPDTYFAIAHELRHKWQFLEDEEFYFGNYCTSKELGIELYNKQVAELEANAYATAIMIDFFEVYPQFSNLPADYKEVVYKMAEAL